MGTEAAVVCANLVVAYHEENMFSLLPTIYPQDFVQFIIQNYFRFLDDILHKWLKDFDIQGLCMIFEQLDPELKFIFFELTMDVNFLDVSFLIKERLLNTDIYHK